MNSFCDPSSFFFPSPSLDSHFDKTRFSVFSIFFCHFGAFRSSEDYKRNNMLEKIGLPPKPSLRGNTWVVDASHCQGCSSQFTFINRKVDFSYHFSFGLIFFSWRRFLSKHRNFSQLERRPMIYFPFRMFDFMWVFQGILESLNFRSFIIHE